MDVDACHHSDWVEVSHTANACLVDPGRLDRLVTSLREPHHQCPQIVLCIGGRRKQQAIHALFPLHKPSKQSSPCRERVIRDLPGNVATRKRPLQSLAHLHVDTSRTHLPNPVLFADCTPDASIAVRSETRRCHVTKWVDEAGTLPSYGLNSTVITRLLFPFADVICVFSDDFGGLDAVLDRLEDWSADSIPTTVPWRARPRVSVITFANPTTTALEERKRFTSRLRTIKFHRHFSSVRLVVFPIESTAAARDRELCRYVLRSELNAARAQRKSHRIFFTALHLSWFFSRAIRHVASKPSEPFDFVLAASSTRALHPQYPDRLRTFLRLAIQHGVHVEHLIRLLASSVLLDAYPPSGHKFCPIQIFNAVYASSIRRALEEIVAPSTDTVRSLGESTQIAHYLHKIAQMISEWVEDSERTAGEAKRSDSWPLGQSTKGFSGRESSAGDSCAEEPNMVCRHQRDTRKSRRDGAWAQECHVQTLQRLRGKMCWERIALNCWCLLCLADEPQHGFSCTHSICDTCVKRFGRPQAAQEYCYTFTACPLCGTLSTLRIILQPPTAGVRILSVDGGGVRGVIPLQFLNLLQAAIGRAGRIQDYFDIGFGVSAGAIIVYALLGLDWDIARCTTFFRGYARRTLDAPLTSQKLRPASIRSLIQCLVTDGHYSPESVSSALRECVGGSLRLFDHPVSGTSRCRIAVTATTIDDVSTVIFANYNPFTRSARHPNGHVQRALATYRRFPRDLPEAEPRLWEVLGATSAAPPYFHPVQVGKEGKYQDGGLHNPNPTDIAIEESSAIFDTQRDLILSLGTGLPPPIDSSPARSYFSRQSRSCSGLRLLRGLRRVVSDAWDAERVHQAVLRWLSALDTHAAERYHRLNLVAADGLPPLDDARCMESLMHNVELCPDVQKLPQIVATLLASSFFLELDGMPTYGSDGQYMCSGTIRVRGNPKHVLELAGTADAGNMQFVKGIEELGDLWAENSLCTSCERYHRPITFTVPELEGAILISLRLGRGATYRISGFPQSVNSLIAKQGLDNPFAHAVASAASTVYPAPLHADPLTMSKRRMGVRTRSKPSKRRKTGVIERTWI